MAPFKLKFRMGSSRSTSQEHEPDPQVNEALLNHQIGASTSTIDSVDCNSLQSLNTSERKLLLPNASSQAVANNSRVASAVKMGKQMFWNFDFFLRIFFFFLEVVNLTICICVPVRMCAYYLHMCVCVCVCHIFTAFIFAHNNLCSS